MSMLTKKMRDLLFCIDAFSKKHGYSPSYCDLRDGTGRKSTSGVYRTVLALEERGYIRRLKGRDRALEVIKLPVVPYAALCPYCGAEKGKSA